MNDMTPIELSYPPLTDYEPVQLVTADLIEAFWPLCRPLLDRCVRETMHGEFTVDDLRAFALAGRITFFIVTNDRTGRNPYKDVVMCLAIEPILYPSLPGINIMAMGGVDLGKNKAKFWQQFKGWAFMSGARFIDAMVSPRMQRILARWDFEQVYVHMRLDLTEKQP